MSEWLAKWRRIWALTRKETRQIIRDPSSIAIGGVVPVMMILLFGYGMSLDVTQVSVAVIDQDRSSDSAALIGAFRLSPYFKLQPARSMAEATKLVLDRKVDGVLQIPSDFSRRWHDGAAEIQILVDGTDANQARIMQGYAEGPVALWSAAQPGSTPNPALPATRRRLAAGRPGPTSINDHWGVCAVDDVDVDTQGGVIKLGRCRRCGRALCVFT
jgi:hypothetical protein